MSDLRKIIIDDQEIEVDGAMTLIQACEQVGVEVPRFCYHERLTIAGNCRMCLVEVVGGAAETRGVMRHAGARFAPRPGGAIAGRQNQFANGEKSPRRGDGVFAHQPPAGLPNL